MVDSTRTQDASRKYSRIHVALTLLSIGLNIGILSLVVLSPLSGSFRDISLSISAIPVLTIACYFFLYFIFSWIIDLPLDVYSSYVIEHRFGLSNQTKKAWIGDELKKRGLSFLFGLVVIEVVYGVLHWQGHEWWIWCWAIFIFFSIILNKLVPVFIVPLFYTYSPITDETIRALITDLVKNTSLRISNMYSLNLSKTTKKANAAFMGLGKTKRVVLADTLLNNFTPAEIRAVVAHEIGHCVRKHLWKNVATSTVVSFGMFAVVNYVLLWGVENGMLLSMTDVAGFPLIALCFTVASTVLMPFQNWFSRRMEREADTYALDATRDKAAFISTMKRLGEMNLSNPSPHPVIEALLYSHPSLRKRIEWAEHYHGA